ncbi:hypothetical protein [Eleftheria terrae]|uniref:hypothetical protein n=1 Tax=Eleftheria terrae TaxID=1597781 RepID=UPI00263B4861|nr:hypothetical protein [Eleftheria terrae]WKB50548.1 hypothetical protein N7L95_00070 [Eleftheria terrae]
MSAARAPSLARLAIGSVLAYLAFNEAWLYGGIWELRAHPAREVEVTLSDNKTVLKGDLSRAWTKEWVLETKDGQQWHFEDYAVMRFTPSEPEHPRGAHHWRSLLPPLLIAWAWLAWLLKGIAMPVFSGRSEGH